ncbi:MAG: hypothetical protein U1E63_02810 [Burkholderiales bacterium]
MVIGDCPACGRSDGYGNVSVSGGMLLRGCVWCRHVDHVRLPQLNKKILYLDQFFYSHAFRAANPAFMEAKDKIEQLAYKQLLVAPYCDIHEDETHLWRPENREQLWKFIKQTSAGHHFWPEYHVKEHQLFRAFEAFLRGDDPVQSIERDDALPDDLNQWDDYLWIDVSLFQPDAAAIRSRKNASASALLDRFPEWASTPSTFQQDVRIELGCGARSYLDLYADYIKRMIWGDMAAMLASPVDSQIVETLMHYDSEHLTPSLRMQRIQAFFASDHYANVPVDRIASEFFGLLRHMLRQGAFSSRAKAEKHFKGFFYDVRFISTYAPYCDAMVVDTLMHRWATDPLIDLPARFGTRFFSRRNWREFLVYLDDIQRGLDPELERALQLVHPPDAKAPNWSGILKDMH